MEFSDKIRTDYVDNLIEKSLSAKPQIHISTSRYLFLNELVSRTSNKTKIRAEALSILFAAHDTTSGLLTNVFFELARRPDIWARLSSEVSTLNGQKPSYEQLKNMKYLRAVLNESQRIRPIVPGNGRQAREDTVLPLGGGEDGKSPILVKKGQLVIFAIYSMHRRKDLYGEDADVFRPERWLDTEDQKGLRMGWEYLPFSGGARVCIGRECSCSSLPSLPPIPATPPLAPLLLLSYQPYPAS
jgi:cytochrome P450